MQFDRACQPLFEGVKESDEDDGIRAVASNRHIMLVNSSLTCGGAQRVASIMANRWVIKNDRATIVTIYSKGPDHFKLDPRVQRLCLNMDRPSKTKLHGLLNNYVRIRRLRNVIKRQRPSVIISFQDHNNVLTLLATHGLGIPVVISERNDPRMRWIAPIWNRLRRIVYRRASALVIQTQSLQEWGESIVDPKRVHVLPNPVDPSTIEVRMSQRNASTIVAAGRLVNQKGFDLLLQAVACCKAKWSLIIVGGGPEKQRLEELAEQLGIADKVQFLGQVKDPAVVFRTAGLFVLSSRYEGFPNVLVEAMACGLAVISFDCMSGPNEIIRHGVDGLLVPAGDVNALAAAMDRLLVDNQERMRLAERAPDVVNRFSTDQVMSKWDSLISSVSQVRA